MAFHDLMFHQCQPAAAIERRAGDVYIQLNPVVADGKEAFIIVAHWEVLLPVREQSANDNTMFCSCPRCGIHYLLPIY